MEERNIIILGSGVAGLAAAIYNARAELKPLVLTGMQDGGQIGTTTEVENYPGFPDGIMGPELVGNMKKQAERFGAEVVMDEATEFSVNPDGSISLKTMIGEYKTSALIIATGASARWLGLEEEEKYKSRGVHTCATCDGAFYKEKEIFIVGGGDSACEEADFLTKFASKVIMLVRGDKMRASVPMQDRVAKNEKIFVEYNSSISKYLGDEKGLTGVVLKNANGEEERKIDGVFLAIGHIPNTAIFKGKLDMDSLGYLIANQKTETNVSGVFAAGDMRTGQSFVVKAMSDAKQAALCVDKWVLAK